jgi:virulence factor Mce-like protein
MGHRKKLSGGGPLNNPLLVGAVLLLVTMTGVILSYNANKGLPFVPTFEINADVPDSAELIAGSSEVRIGGARVGIVKTITAVPPKGKQRAFARLRLALDANQKGLSSDSQVQIRPRSVLGAKFVDLTPGKGPVTLQPGQTLGLHQAKAIVELDEAFNTFDKPTTDALRTVIINLGDALAGRGSDLNDVTSSVARIVPPLQRVLTVLVDSKTDLAGFLRGLARTTGAIGPVAPQLGSLFDGAAVTLAAIDNAGGSLGDTIAELPPTEQVGTRALTDITPVLSDAAAITEQLRPSTTLIRSTSRALADAVEVGTPILRRTPRLARDLRASLTSLDNLARDPAASGAVRKLITTVQILRPVLEYALPAQITCNLLPLALRNLGGVVSDGDAAGTWLSFTPMFDLSQTFQAATFGQLNNNSYPIENASQCEGGNETYQPGQHIGNPAGNQPARTEMTVIDPTVKALAQQAGLLKRDDLP